MRSSTTVARRRLASPKKPERPSTVIDRYQTAEKLKYGIFERPTRRGQTLLAHRLMDTLKSVSQDEEQFSARDAPTRVMSDADARAVYHEFCEEFCEKAGDNRRTLHRLTSNSKSARELLGQMRKDLEELERRSYRIEMDLPDPEE